MSALPVPLPPCPRLPPAPIAPRTKPPPSALPPPPFFPRSSLPLPSPRRRRRRPVGAPRGPRPYPPRGTDRRGSQWEGRDRGGGRGLRVGHAPPGGASGGCREEGAERRRRRAAQGGGWGAAGVRRGSWLDYSWCWSKRVGDWRCLRKNKNVVWHESRVWLESVKSQVEGAGCALRGPSPWGGRNQNGSN